MGAAVDLQAEAGEDVMGSEWKKKLWASYE
jgi:hypothetical protein